MINGIVPHNFAFTLLFIKNFLMFRYLELFLPISRLLNKPCPQNLHHFKHQKGVDCLV